MFVNLYFLSWAQFVFYQVNKAVIGENSGNTFTGKQMLNGVYTIRLGQQRLLCPVKIKAKCFYEISLFFAFRVLF